MGLKLFEKQNFSHLQMCKKNHGLDVVIFLYRSDAETVKNHSCHDEKEPWW